MSSDELFIERSLYYLTREYPSKIRQCLEILPESAVWSRTNESCNSIGNLLLHLAGNIRQWIVGGAGGRPVDRHRAAEFAARDGATKAELIEKLENVLRESAGVLDSLSPDELAAPRLIQGRETTVLGAIYHVIEHFAMHTGQIVHMTKVQVPGAIHFYEDAGELARPLWKRGDDVTKPSGRSAS
jgi:uncharacterized damage-inducible protein DinB